MIRLDCFGLSVALRAQIRLYRVRWFFEHLEYNLTLSLLWVTLIRNLLVCSQQLRPQCCSGASLLPKAQLPYPALRQAILAR